MYSNISLCTCLSLLRWSEYGQGYLYDDDGENHDGSSTWYQTRTQAFRANTAYSLYGVLKGDFSLRSCTQGTYINSFFTTGGADTVISALALTVKNNGNDNNPGVNCYVIEQEQNNNKNNNNDNKNNNNDNKNNNHRRAKSNDNNNNNNNNNKNYMSTTLGCTDSGTFAVATFDGKTCDGTYFTNTTDDLPDYNDAMFSATCKKVWDLSKSYTYTTAVTTLLEASAACDVSMYGSMCPDPFGKKHLYSSAVTVVSKSKARRSSMGWDGPLRVLSWMCLVAGMGLSWSAYMISSRHQIRERGGGMVGTVRTIAADVSESMSKMAGSVTKTNPKKSSGSSRRRKGYRSNSKVEDDGTIAPPSLGITKPPETAGEAQTRRLWRLGGERTKKESSKSRSIKKNQGVMITVEKPVGRSSSTHKSKETTTAAVVVGVVGYEPPDKMMVRKAAAAAAVAKTPASPPRRYNPPVDKFDKYVMVPGVSESTEDEIAANIDSPSYVPPGLRKADSGRSNGDIV